MSFFFTLSSPFCYCNLCVSISTFGLHLNYILFCTIMLLSYQGFLWTNRSVSLSFCMQVYMHAELLGQPYNKTRASLAKERVEGQVCVTTDMFRSTVSRRRPSSCTISPVCLPWNAATDSDSSLEQQGIIWKGWQNQHTVCRLSPCYSGSFGSTVFFGASKACRRCRPKGRRCTV